MITNEKEVRIAIEAILTAVLVFYGFYGCALVMIVVMLPWKPFLATGAYLVQPILEWREREARRYQAAQAVNEGLDPLPLDSAERGSRAHADAVPILDLSDPLETPLPRGRDQSFIETKKAVQPAIETHLRESPNLLLGNMNLEVEDVHVNGDVAEALVKFQSAQVHDLAFEVRYLLRRARDHWEVESSSPANGTGMSRHGGMAVPVTTLVSAVAAPRPEI